MLQTFRKPTLLLAAVISATALSGHTLARPVFSPAPQSPSDGDRTVLTQALPRLDGSHLEVTLVEVSYAPGESDKPHSHPCAVVGYMLEGAFRTQVQGGPERVLHAGDSFYEPPNGVHSVSANASSTDPAKFLAYFICDHPTPLTVPPPAPKSASKPAGENFR